MTDHKQCEVCGDVYYRPIKKNGEPSSAKKWAISKTCPSPACRAVFKKGGAARHRAMEQARLNHKTAIDRAYREFLFEPRKRISSRKFIPSQELRLMMWECVNPKFSLRAA